MAHIACALAKQYDNWKLQDAATLLAKACLQAALTELPANLSKSAAIQKRQQEILDALLTPPPSLSLDPEEASSAATKIGTMPSVIKTVAPTYPAEASRAGQEGVVILIATLDETGQLRNLSIDSSSGYPLLDQAAIETARQWQYVPAKDSSGTNIASQVGIPISFILQIPPNSLRPR